MGRRTIRALRAMRKVIRIERIGILGTECCVYRVLASAHEPDINAGTLSMYQVM